MAAFVRLVGTLMHHMKAGVSNFRPLKNSSVATNHSFAFRSRSALRITDTELKLMAAPAITGLSSTPNSG